MKNNWELKLDFKMIRLCRQAEMSVEQLANQLGIHRTTLVNIELGRTTPSLKVYFNLCSIFHTMFVTNEPIIQRYQKRQANFLAQLKGGNYEG